MDDPVVQTMALGTPWPTIDPFLFCVHHLDRYPAANAEMGPAASLDGRQLGQDFAGSDGWNMYHGRVVPGFPQHPHRGFETITFVRRGLVDHADSYGAAARFGRGDVQWMTAGRGIVHSEMFPLFDISGPNPLELFQIWLNLPPEDKLAEPHFSMLWDHRIPRVDHIDGVEIAVIAGQLGDARPPPPPPSSWAARPDSDVAIWHIQLDVGARFTLPPAAAPDTVRTLYVFEGSELRADDRALDAYSGAVLRCDAPVVLTTGTEPVECLVLQGRPIGAPVAQYGPFVMNNRAELEQAFIDYQRDGFGGWSWSSDGPVHGSDPERFAQHPDGRVETAAS